MTSFQIVLDSDFKWMEAINGSNLEVYNRSLIIVQNS